MKLAAAAAAAMCPSVATGANGECSNHGDVTKFGGGKFHYELEDLVILNVT